MTSQKLKQRRIHFFFLSAHPFWGCLFVKHPGGAGNDFFPLPEVSHGFPAFKPPQTTWPEKVFGESVSDDEVYQQCAADAVEHMLGGKVASLFMFLCFGVFFSAKFSFFFFKQSVSGKNECFRRFFWWKRTRPWNFKQPDFIMDGNGNTAISYVKIWFIIQLKQLFINGSLGFQVCMKIKILGPPTPRNLEFHPNWWKG